MKNHKERSAKKRCSYQAPITCAYFNSNRFYHAKKTNHSKDCISFVSDFPLISESSIYIRIDYNTPGEFQEVNCNCGGVRHLGLAEVKWCQEEAGEDCTYRVGLKYHEPAF